MLQAIKFGGTFKMHYQEGNDQTVSYSYNYVLLDSLKKKVKDIVSKYDVHVTLDTSEHNTDVFTKGLENVNQFSALPYKEASVLISPSGGKSGETTKADEEFRQFLQDEYTRNNSST